MKLLFFHTSDNFIPVFGAHPSNVHTALHGNFYWCYDRYHSYTPLPFVDRYLHLFFVDTKEVGDIRFMQGNKNLRDVERYLQEVRSQEVACKNVMGIAPILRSRAVLQPKIVIDFMGNRLSHAKVVVPDTKYGIELKLFDEKLKPIPFTHIPELIRAVPDLVEYFPFHAISDMMLGESL